MVTALRLTVTFNGNPISVGQHLPTFFWTIEGVHCTGVTCTALMASSSGLPYSLIWDGSRWTAKAAGRGLCGPNHSQTDDYVNTVTFAPATISSTTTTPAMFAGAFEESLTGACLPGGGHFSATLTMRRV